MCGNTNSKNKHEEREKKAGKKFPRTGNDYTEKRNKDTPLREHVQRDPNREIGKKDK